MDCQPPRRSLLGGALASRAPSARAEEGGRPCRQGQRLDPKKFLSDLPEEVDIRYRTNIVVVGDQALVLIGGACASSSAKLLDSTRELSPAPKAPTVLWTPPTLDARLLTQAVEGFLVKGEMSDRRLLEALSAGPSVISLAEEQETPTSSCGSTTCSGSRPTYQEPGRPSPEIPAPSDLECFCRVDENGSVGNLPGPAYASTNSNKTNPGITASRCSSRPSPGLVKMGFVPITTFGQDMPTCSSRKEALCTCMVFPLVVDSDNLEEQLQDLKRLSQEVGFRTRNAPETKPWRSVLLIKQAARDNQKDFGDRSSVSSVLQSFRGSIRSSITSSSGGDLSWRQRLADWELENGVLWKHGPVHLEDGNAMYNLFAQISVEMLTRSLNLKNKTPGLLMESWGEIPDGKRKSFERLVSSWSDELNAFKEAYGPPPPVKRQGSFGLGLMKLKVLSVFGHSNASA